MAVVTLVRPTPMPLPSDGIVTVAQPDHFQVVTGSLVADYWGSFQYADGYLSSGLFTRIELGDAQGLLMRVEQINPAVTAERFFYDLLQFGEREAAATLFSYGDSVTGSSGDDTIEAFWGTNTLAGGAGNDIYMGYDDVIVERPGEGIDWLYTHALGQFTLPDNVENLQLLEAPFPGNDGRGNALGNFIAGSSGANVLEGLDGNDTLDGRGGADTLRGGSGDDTYLLAAPQWDVQLVIEDSAGVDTVRIAHTHALTAGIDNLVLTGDAAIDGTGNELANRITGTAGSNRIDGGAGADTMEGGAGDDTYVIDSTSDLVVDTAGIDTIETWLEGHTLVAAGIENLTLLGDVIAGTGNAGHNYLTGNGANNILTGGAGNDTLDGGVGTDTLNGGTGDDTYVLADEGDVFAEAANAGYDTLVTVVTTVMPDNFERLLLTGNWNADAIGSSRNDWLGGNDWTNRFYAGAGADTMEGGNSGDWYEVDNSGDRVIEKLLAAGNDSIAASVSIDLGATPFVERAYLTGPGANSATGNRLVNWLFGNDANNVLTAVGGDWLFGEGGNDLLNGSEGNDTLMGGAGADTIIGGAGSDRIYIDDPLDVFVELPDGGNFDILESTFSITLPANFEALILGGEGDIDGSGTAAGGELVTGNQGRNVLHTGGGDGDTLNGGYGWHGGGDTFYDDGGAATLIATGASTFYVDNPNTVLLGSGEHDIVYAGTDIYLPYDIEEVHLLAGTTAVGDQPDNLIVGNAGNNVLAGGRGNDTLEGGAGNDQLIGDADIDTASFTGNRSAYTVTRSGSTIRVQGPDGNDTLTGIDVLHFDDQDVVMNTDVAQGWINLESIDWIEGEPVTAGIAEVYGESAPSPGAVSWQWFRNGHAIAGATQATYTPGPIDRNAELDVTASWTDAQGNLEVLRSESASVVPLVQSMTGSVWDDDFWDLEHDDLMRGLSGNDVLSTWRGNDTIDGGDGRDTARLDMLMSDVQGVAFAADGIHIDTAYGDKLLVDVERVIIGGTTYALDTQPGSTIWTANALLWAAFGHAPDGQLLRYWTAMADQMDPAIVAERMIRELAGDVSTDAVVTHLYQVLAGAMPSASQVASYSAMVGPNGSFDFDGELFLWAALQPLNTGRFEGAFTGSIAVLVPQGF